MTTKSAVRFPAVPGIDLSFRPQTYFWPLGLETHLLARIKGVERKAALQRLIDAGRLDEIPDLLARSALTEDERKGRGRIHPAFMGGEYLPDLMENEVEIARITIASTLSDVISVLARRGEGRIYYRVVDEYDGETLSGKTTRTSTRPLMLGELEAFFNGAWSVFECLERNFSDFGYDPDEIRHFSKATSAFYPQIGWLYQQRVEDWTVQRRRELGLDEDEEPESIDDEDEAKSPV